MKNNKAMRKLLALLFIVISAMCTVTFTAADGTKASFEQPVPFGVAHVDDGKAVPVYNKPSTGKASGSIEDYSLCAIVSTERLSGADWYRVNYFDSTGKETSGYISEDNFYQLTTAGLVSILAEPNMAAYLQMFSGMSDSAAFVETSSTGTRSVTAAATERSTVEELPVEQQTYVLNKNTKKFHYPSCSSADDIKPKNRKEYTGTREEVIQMGYTPCKRCNP